MCTTKISLYEHLASYYIEEILAYTFFLLLFIDAPSDAAIGRFGAGAFLLCESLSQTGLFSCLTLPVDFHFFSEDSLPF